MMTADLSIAKERFASQTMAYIPRTQPQLVGPKPENPPIGGQQIDALVYQSQGGQSFPDVRYTPQGAPTGGNMTPAAPVRRPYRRR
jgi:hypothetical protein